MDSRSSGPMPNDGDSCNKELMHGPMSIEQLDNIANGKDDSWLKTNPDLRMPLLTSPALLANVSDPEYPDANLPSAIKQQDDSMSAPQLGDDSLYMLQAQSHPVAADTEVPVTSIEPGSSPSGRPPTERSRVPNLGNCLLGKPKAPGTSGVTGLGITTATSRPPGPTVVGPPHHQADQQRPTVPDSAHVSATNESSHFLARLQERLKTQTRQREAAEATDEHERRESTNTLEDEPRIGQTSDNEDGSGENPNAYTSYDHISSPTFPDNDDYSEANGSAMSGKKRRRKRKQPDSDKESRDQSRAHRAKEGRRSFVHDDDSESHDDFDSMVAQTRAWMSSGKTNKKGKKPTLPILRADNVSSSKSTTKKPPKAKKSRPLPPKMTNTDTVFGTNIFDDVAQTAGLLAQPTFAASNRRAEAMKGLIESAPAANKEQVAADARELDKAIREFDGRGRLKPADEGHWLLSGMKTPLKAFQVMGVARMRQMEKSDTVKGGILADQMGMGKTVMSLANIINDTAEKGEQRSSTLIVANQALLKQWCTEIKLHCETRRENKKYGINSIAEHRAGCRIEGANAVQTLEGCDIVFTTYYEVSASYPRADPPEECVTEEEKAQWWQGYFEEHRGILHRATFHRIVLDEAQAIKNHRSYTSIACRALQAKHYWCISGTPLYNTLDEFYPYFKFLREPNTHSFEDFKSDFCTPDDPKGIERLNALLQTSMIRRTHRDTMFGARLVDLPKTHEREIWLDLNPVERHITKVVTKRMLQRTRTQMRGQGKQCDYKVVLLRLRQICTHVLLIRDALVDYLEREDFDALNSISGVDEDQSDDEKQLLYHIRKMLYETLDKDGILRAAAGKLGQKLSAKQYLDEIVHHAQWDEITGRSECVVCSSRAVNPWVTSCGHIYCLACLETQQSAEARVGRKDLCRICHEEYNTSKPLHKDPGVVDQIISTSKQAGSRTGGRQPDMEDWLSSIQPMPVSTKTRAVKAQLAEWMAEDPDTKIIVFSQFTTVLRILAGMCNDEQWNYCSYIGKVSAEQREATIENFRTWPSLRIMLATLQCGGIGLNLTMACKVILLEPWWNNAGEQQAFCRVFRIGQTRETELVRFYCRDTIEEYMMTMKADKQKKINTVMGTSSHSGATPTLNEFKRMLELADDAADASESTDAEARGNDDDGHSSWMPPRRTGVDDDDYDWA